MIVIIRREFIFYGEEQNWLMAKWVNACFKKGYTHHNPIY